MKPFGSRSDDHFNSDDAITLINMELTNPSTREESKDFKEILKKL